jgi:hypothetical protein
VLTVSGIRLAFLHLLEDPGLWGGAPSVLGWVGSTVNQHCRLRLEALLGFGGEHGLGERALFVDFWWLGAAKSPLYCAYLVYLGTGY